MKVLLDHDLPKQLRLEFPGHLVLTARQMGWDTLSNGKLLAAAQGNGFDLLITADQSMYAQQNHADRRVALLVLTNSRLPALRAFIGPIQQAVERCQPGGYEVLPVPFYRCRILRRNSHRCRTSKLRAVLLK